MSSQKRSRKSLDAARHRQRRGPTAAEGKSEIPSSAYAAAYEAQLVYGRDDLAQAVSQRDDGGEGGSSVSRRALRGSLIKWSGDVEGEEEIWLDR